MNILVVGGGSIGQRHVKNLKALGVSVAVVDVNPDRKPDFSSIEAACAADHFQAAFVCSPSRFHMEQATQCAERGMDLFIEKPLSHTLSGTKKLMKLTKLKNLVTMVGSNWKFYPSFQKMKELLDAGAIGKVLSARCEFGQYLPDWHPWEDYRKGYSANKKLGGGILLDCHEFDYLPWFMGKKVTKVFCMAATVSDLAIDVEDVAEAVLQFDGGAIGEIHVDYIQRVYQRNFEFFGSDGTILWDTNWKKVVLKSKINGEKEFPLSEGYDVNTMYVEEVKHFLNCVEHRTETITPIEKGAEVLQLILAAKKSAESGKVVAL
jgi:predicted dehydrogenase